MWTIIIIILPFIALIILALVIYRLILDRREDKRTRELIEEIFKDL